MAKTRVDQLLVSRGLAESREKAQRMILAGEVLVDDRPADKPGARVREDCTLRLRGRTSRFVGRGGEKLRGALEAFGLDVTGLSALDIGASTGGFTDCLLQAGVGRVVALDVGSGQLHWRLYSDRRVTPREKINARYLKIEDLPHAVDLVVIDVSFISVTKILPNLARILRERPLSSSSASLARSILFVILVKPQFELSPQEIGKGGIVREARLHAKSILKVASLCVESGVFIRDITPSVLPGMEGNREFFLLAELRSNDHEGPALNAQDIEKRVATICHRPSSFREESTHGSDNT